MRHSFKKLRLQKHRVQKYFLFLIFPFILFPGCKKAWLEAKVNKKLAVPATVKDFQAMMDHVVNINKNTCPYGEVAADGHYYNDGDFSAMTPAYQNVYARKALQPFSGITNDIFRYSNLYRVILDMNIILEEAKKSIDMDKDGLEQVKAQALFIRACNFFDVASNFATPYKSATANSDLGIALRLNTIITEQSTRSTVRQTYDQIVSDLLASKDVLPEVPFFLTRASKPAALGMLAKVYLSMGDYANAQKYADEYLSIKNNLLDYNTISSSANFIGVNSEVAFLSFFQGASQLTTLYFVDQSLYDSYNSNDLRKQIFFKVAPAGIIFKGQYSTSSSDNFCGVSTDEMYLIRAEGYARAGNFSAAMKDLNDLMRTRWLKGPTGISTYVDLTASNETDALMKIFSERRKQLILRNVRWTDLRRLNQDERFKVTLSRVISGQIHTLEPNSQQYTFPIPQEVVQVSGLNQNPGWE